MDDEAAIRAQRTAAAVVPDDGLPIIGHSQRVRNLHSITTNSGISLGPCLGTLMSGEILTGTHELLDPYRSTRFG